jgi:anti-anti-sigma factor
MKLSTVMGKDGIMHVELAGRLDQITAPAVSQRLSLLIELGYCRLCINLADVTCLEKEGLDTLYQAMQEAQRAGGNLCITNLTEQMQALLATEQAYHELRASSSRGEGESTRYMP